MPGVDGSYRFDRVAGVYGFLNYLYRTDAGQRWTTEETPSCLDVVAPTGLPASANASPFGDLPSRREHHGMAMLGMKRHYSSNNLATTRLAKGARAFLIDSDGGEVDWAALASVMWQVMGAAGLIPLATVVHVDQGPAHMHGLYAQGSSRRGGGPPKGAELRGTCIGRR